MGREILFTGLVTIAFLLATIGGLAVVAMTFLTTMVTVGGVPIP